ncbi:predicted protein [Histoplasma capsulatum var. duboisii H88]|uniref:Predicted protein n=2 Tax=Ajellomyces capsulatus TaxID=5037 RepID=F0UR26_AJEC8|nr:predicted protein [Histoplasma capsulatum H143]EGC48353.1 predicted protein [Histoplasma capsulatum var. duboisii H88]
MTTDKKHLRSQLPVKEKCPYRIIAPQISPSIQLEWQLTETVTNNIGLLVSCDQVQGFCQHPTQVSIQVAVKLSLKQGVVVFGSEPQVGSETMIVAPTGISGIEITHKEDCNDRAKILCCF